MIKLFLKVPILWTVIFILRLIVIVLGLVMVPIGLKWFSFNNYKFIQYPKWWMYNITGIFWPWGNDRDGALGDKRGAWAKKCSGKVTDFKNMFWWLAIRNPANNFSRFTPFIAVDMSTVSSINLIAGRLGDLDDKDHPDYQFLSCKDERGFEYFKYEQVLDILGKRFHILVGHKFDYRHLKEWDDKQKAWKGFTMRIRAV